MTKQELLDAIATWPDDELFFVLRGSNPAVPEAIREYARRVLYLDRMASTRAPDNSTREDVRRITTERHQKARADADAAFALADRMDALAPEWIAQAETAAGLRADTKNVELEAEREAEEARKVREKEEAARQNEEARKAPDL